ncbi:MAG: NYN domain-containing protein [Nitrospira sp.]|nr:NYN domain-containing protein [Nitrospira sp.]
MRSCIFVDGENLRHSLIDLFAGEFDPQDYLPKTARWHEFFDFLAANCYSSEKLRAYWYVVGKVDFWPWNLPHSINDHQKLVNILRKHDPFAKALNAAANERTCAENILHDLEDEQRKIEKRFHGWLTLQNGIVGQHDEVEFRRAGTIHYNLCTRRFGSEKAVDVKLSIDMLHLKDIYDVAVIVSGDGDYVPAVQVIKDCGKKVVNVSFETRSGDLLPGGARTLNQITDKVLTVKYNQIKPLLLP